MPTVTGIAVGNHTYNINAISVNGGADPNTSNNTKSSSFTVSAGLNFNYTQDF